MKRTFPVIDADGHILEKDHELREFLPPEFRAVPGKREYPLFSWDGWARGALVTDQALSIPASSCGCAFSMRRRLR
jgi:hypothetical protein